MEEVSRKPSKLEKRDGRRLITQLCRRLISALLAISTMFVAMASSIFATAIPAIMVAENLSREVSTLGVSLYVLGFATGPIIWASFSELKGRYLPNVISLFGFSVFSFAAARSGHDVASIFICRYFAGFFGAGPLTLTGATFSDMFPPGEVGTLMTLYSLTVFLGPLLSQPIGGFIILNKSLGWEWTEYLPGILGGAVFIALLFVQQESYHPVILARKADRLRRETGDWSIISKHDTLAVEPRDIVRGFLLLPLRMLVKDPIVLCMCTFGSFVYGLLYLFLTAYPAIFQKVHHMNPGVGGLPYLGIMVGQLIYVVCNIFFRNKWMMPRLKQNKYQMVPEWNLPMAIPGAAAFSAGLFWLGWSGYKASIHWIVPTASGIFSGFGLLAMFVPSIAYVVTARQKRLVFLLSFHLFSIQLFLTRKSFFRAASAVAAHAFLRSLFGAAFPLFSTFMVSLKSFFLNKKND